MRNDPVFDQVNMLRDDTCLNLDLLDAPLAKDAGSQIPGNTDVRNLQFNHDKKSLPSRRFHNQGLPIEHLGSSYELETVWTG